MSHSGPDGLTTRERDVLAAILDALIPPAGSFPAPSETDMIDDFILKHLPPEDAAPPYPGLDLVRLRRILDDLGSHPDITAALQRLERGAPAQFQSLWALAVFGYYSRPAVTDAIQRDLAPGYHGAPLPRGYAHVIAPWDASDPLQMPGNPTGRYIATDDVRPVDLSRLEGDVR
jgi:hypothetical protein